MLQTLKQCVVWWVTMFYKHKMLVTSPKKKGVSFIIRTMEQQQQWKKHIISKNHDFYKRRGQERSKQQTCLSHNVITKHFGSTNPYKDEDATQK